MYILHSHCVSEQQLTVTYEEQEVITSDQLQLEHVWLLCLKMTGNIKRWSKRCFHRPLLNHTQEVSALKPNMCLWGPDASSSRHTAQLSCCTYSLETRRLPAASSVIYCQSEGRRVGPDSWTASVPQRLRDQLSSEDNNWVHSPLMCSGAGRTPGC